MKERDTSEKPLGEYHYLILAVVRQAVDDLNGSSSDSKNPRADAMEAARFLISMGPQWFRALGIGLNVGGFYEWIEGRLKYWEEYERATA